MLSRAIECISAASSQVITLILKTGAIISQPLTKNTYFV